MRALVSALAILLLATGPASGAPAAKGDAAADRPAKGRAPSYPLARNTPEEVRAWLGDPAVANEEGKGALWTYRLDDCALMVFFKDEGQGLRVSGVATGPRRRAEEAPSAESCIASAKK